MSDQNVVGRNVAFANKLIEAYGREPNDAFSALLGSAMDVEEETKSDILVTIENTSKSDLLHGPTLDRLAGTGNLSAYLCAMMNALGVVKSSAMAGPIRSLVFIYSIKALTQTQLGTDAVKILVATLKSNDHYLTGEQIQLIVENALRQLLGMAKSLETPQELASFGGVLDIIISLTSKCTTATRTHVHRSLISFNGGNWPPRAILILSSSLTDLCDTEEDCELALTAMIKYAHWNSEIEAATSSSSSSTSSSSLDVTAASSSATAKFTPDNLPALFYIITSFRIKCGHSVNLKRKVVKMVADVVDLLIVESADDFASQSGKQIQARAVLSTVTHHLSELVAKDSAMSAEIISYLKGDSLLMRPSLYVQRSCTDASARRKRMESKKSKKLSLAKFLLCFLVAGSPNHEEKVIKGMCDLVKSVVKMEEVRKSSLWVSEAALEEHVGVRLNQLFVLFDSLIEGPLMADMLSGAMTKFALTLISECAMTRSGTTGTVVNSQVDFLPQINKDSKTLEGFGIHLVLVLYKSCSDSRLKILKDIGIRLDIASDLSTAYPISPGSDKYSELTSMWCGDNNRAHAAAATGGGGTGRRAIEACAVHTFSEMKSAQLDAVLSARSCIRIYSRLARDCAGTFAYTPGIMKQVEDTIVNALGRLPPVMCEELITSITPLFDMWKPFFDKCMLCVNKVCLSRDVSHRQAAVVSKICLIEYQVSQLRQQEMVGVRSSSSSSTATAIDTNERQLKVVDCLDDSCGQLRRFLQHQGNVRAIMYDRIYKMQCVHPESRPQLIHLLSTHLHNFVKFEEDRRPQTVTYTRGFKEYPDLNKPCTMYIDIDMCIDSSSVPSERLSGLFLTLLALATEFLQSSSSPSSSSSLSSSRHAVVLNNFDDDEGHECDEDDVYGLNDTTIAIDVCQSLWLISQSSCIMDLYDDFGLVEGSDVHIDKNALCREVVMIDLLHACSAVVANLPKSLGGVHILQNADRAILLGKLASSTTQAETLHANHLAVMKKAKKDSQKKRLKKRSNEKKKKAKARHGRVAGGKEGGQDDDADGGCDDGGQDDSDDDDVDDDDAIDDQGDGNDDAARIEYHHATDISSVVAEEGIGLSIHVIRAKLSYASFVIRFLYDNEDADDVAGSDGGGSDERAARSQAASQLNNFDAAAADMDELDTYLLTRAALETSLLCIEALVCCAVSWSEKVIDGSSALDSKFDDLDETSMGLLPLMNSMIRFVYQYRSLTVPDEIKENGLDIGSLFCGYDVGELAFRFFLGCIRLHAVIESVRASSVVDANETGKGRRGLTRETINVRLSHVINLATSNRPRDYLSTKRAYLFVHPQAIKASRCLAVDSLTKGQGFGGDGMTSTATASGKGEGGSGDDLGKVVRQFLEIFSTNLELLFEETTSKQAKSSCVKCNFVLISIISELVQYLQDAKKAKYLAKISMLCDERIKEPSKLMTHSLFKLFVVAACNSADSRRKQIAFLSNAVKQCLVSCDNAIDYDDDTEKLRDRYESEGKGIADFQTSFRFVCRQSLKDGCDDLFSSMNECIHDADILLKAFSRAVRMRKLRKAELLERHDGFISSDEEEMEEGRSSSVSSSSLSKRRGGDKSIAEICAIIKLGFQTANDLLLPVNVRLADTLKGGKVVIEKTLKLYSQLFALQSGVASAILAGGSSVLSDDVDEFRMLALFVGENVTGVVDEHILELQTAPSKGGGSGKGMMEKGKGKGGKGGKIGKGGSSRQETIVPQLVFNMAQLDTKVVALAKKNTALDFTKALPRNVQRDFKFNDQNAMN
jgi:hypothetical protein